MGEVLYIPARRVPSGANENHVSKSTWKKIDSASVFQAHSVQFVLKRTC